VSPRVLVIDDDANVRATIRHVLSRENYRVQCATDGVGGLRIFREFAPDVVITDLIMPQQDGLVTIEEIKRERRAIGIIAISGGGRVGNMDMLRMAKRMGADHVLAKPFSAADLLRTVRTALPSKL
jgi:CheY-like chemotaxis protein